MDCAASNDAAVHFEQGGFHKPGHEGRGGDDQRDDRGVVADGRPHEQAGQGNDRDHEDKKWERAGQVHNDIKHGVDHGPGRDAVLTADDEDRPHHHAEHIGKKVETSVMYNVSTTPSSSISMVA